MIGSKICLKLIVRELRMKKKKKNNQLTKLSTIANAVAFIVLLLILIQQLKNEGRLCTSCLSEKFPILKTNQKDKIENEVLRFAVISDPQVKNDNQLLFLKKALQKAKEEGVKFVVIAGDLSQDGEIQQLKAVKQALDGSGLKYYTTPGNHDVLAGGIDNYKKVFGQPFKKDEIALDNPESKIKKVTLLLLDNSRYIAAAQQIDDRQIVWLENELVKNPKTLDESRLAFMHFPLNSLGQREIELLKFYFCAGRIDGLFAGHLHATERFYTWCPETDFADRKEHIIPTFNVGSITITNYNELEGFQIFYLFEDGEIETERIVVATQAKESKRSSYVDKDYE